MHTLAIQRIKTNQDSLDQPTVLYRVKTNSDDHVHIEDALDDGHCLE